MWQLCVESSPSSALVACSEPVLLCVVGHIAENCTSEQRLCYNCRQPGHESAACPSPRSVAAKQCYSCGGVGHIQAECPSLRLNSGNGSGQKCYVSSRCRAWTSRSVYLPRAELWSLRPHRAHLPHCRRLWRICVSCTPSWTVPEHVHASTRQVLPLRRAQPHGQVR